MKKMRGIKMIRRLSAAVVGLMSASCLLISSTGMMQAAAEEILAEMEEVWTEDAPVLEQAQESRGFSFQLMDQKAILISVSSLEAEVLVIPSQWNGYPVVKIAKNAFNGVQAREIRIPASVVEIGKGAFSECSQLETITVDEGNSVYFVKNGLLMDRSETVLFCCPCQTPQETVEIPESTRIISAYAFSNCKNLKYLEIPKNVRFIETTAFYDASSMEHIDVSPENTEFSSVDGVLMNNNQGLLFYYPAARMEENYVIPETVSMIGCYAFNGCRGVAHLKVDDWVFVTDHAFENAESLLTAEINTDTIGRYAFSHCANLQSVTLKSAVECIMDSAFYGCEQLRQVSMEDGIKEIRSHAFFDCPALQEISVPDSVEYIGEYAMGYRFAEVTEKLPIGTFRIIGQQDTAAEEYAQKTGLSFAIRQDDTDINLQETVDIRQETPAVLKGDVNNDGKVSLQDAVLIINWYINDSVNAEDEMNQDSFYAADMDDDGQITLKDASELLQQYVEQAKTCV